MFNFFELYADYSFVSNSSVEEFDISSSNEDYYISEARDEYPLVSVSRKSKEEALEWLKEEMLFSSEPFKEEVIGLYNHIPYLVGKDLEDKEIFKEISLRLNMDLEMIQFIIGEEYSSPLVYKIYVNPGFGVRSHTLYSKLPVRLGDRIIYKSLGGNFLKGEVCDYDEEAVRLPEGGRRGYKLKM